MRSFLFLGLGMLSLSALKASEQRFASGAGKVSLVELFTSEGCSSCPPAEQWMSTLRKESGLWRDFVPVQFHVNYWDRLGWTDKFSSKEATAREYAYAKVWNADSVYTPCVVRDGEESRTSQKLSAAQKENAGELSVTVDAGGVCHVEYAASAMNLKPATNRQAAFEVQLALLGSGFKSKVTAGENRGETLAHEFVVCGATNVKLTASADGIYRGEIALPKSQVAEIPQRALAVWVTHSGEIKPVQATGGWLAAN